MRVLGLDYGSKTIGVAITDGLGITVQPLETITRPKESIIRKSLVRIEEIISEYDVDKIVLGYPINMSGVAGERAQKTLEFKKRLEERTGLPVFLCDERLTTVEADDTLAQSGVKQQDRKKYIDQVAAVLILRDYLQMQQEK